jgi:signal transduction histidine kinase/DNA-binding response OmpR family regulator
LLGKTGYDFLVHKDDRHIIVAKNKSRLSGQMDSYEVKGSRLSGETIWLKISGTPILDVDGKVVGSVGIMSDITAQKALEAQLISAHKMEAIGQLAGGIAHDFNNLLTVIMGYSEELHTHLSPDNPLYHNAEEILKAGNRASSLTKQLLTFSRKQVIQPQVLDINVLVTDTYTMLTRLIGEHIHIVTELSPSTRFIKADAGHVEQVIVNLVLNARDAMPTGGRITLSTSEAVMDVSTATDDLKAGVYAVLTVTDTGHGMDSESQKAIFDPFYTTKAKGKGLGLGLFNVYWIVKQSGGQIKVLSEPGKGTAIQVWFPVTGETREFEPQLNPAYLQLGGGESILIVEDGEALCSLIKQIVSGLGYRVTACSNGSLAWQAIQRGLQPDLIITDIVMPSMNGKELADKVWAANPQQKILFMSGFTDDAFGHPDVSIIKTHLIQKPFTMAEIAAQIRKVLGAVSSVKPSKATILMLDDDANIRLFVKRAGKARGHSLLEAETAQEAIAVLSQNQVDVILLDLKLQGVSGIDALAEIRAAGFNLPVIAFSGALDQNELEQLKPLGVITGMEKSFDNLPLFLFIEGLISAS